jgi:pyrimidine-nucleoside phosphorylase
MEETPNLTMSMVHSGDMIDLSSIKGIKVDKHSTGGVGDTTTLVVGPMVAACGAPVAKMSGRGLGHTGGTIDKLESIKGFSVEMTEERFMENVNKVKLAVGGQTGNLAPADKKLYALRDVTATVDNVSLIASSIMSKKIAAGADCIVLDVKIGSGAFMKDVDSGIDLAKEMVKIGTGVGRRTIGVLSDMDQPLGFAVGNALEVKEAIETLKGDGPADLYELCLTLGSYMLLLGNSAESIEDARKKLIHSIESGSALNKFKEFIEAQGGDSSVVDDTSLLPNADIIYNVKSTAEGFVSKIAATDVGKAALVLGAGRETKESAIDLSVGIVIKKKVGDFVKADDVIAEIHGNSMEKVMEAEGIIKAAYSYSSEPPILRPLILGIVTDEGVKNS